MPVLPGPFGACVCHLFECRLLTVGCFDNISSSTLYGVTKLVTEGTKLVTREESLTLGGDGGRRTIGRKELKSEPRTRTEHVRRPKLYGIAGASLRTPPINPETQTAPRTDRKKKIILRPVQRCHIATGPRKRFAANRQEKTLRCEREDCEARRHQRWIR